MKSLFILFISIALSGTVFGQIKFQEHIVFDNRNSADKPGTLFSADVDGDGNMDIISASSIGGSIAWYANQNGLGDFGPKNIVYTNSADINSLFATDLDGDGDIDILSASEVDISWFENLDGLGDFGDQKTITSEIIGGTFVYASDVDGDGDMDVLSASRHDDKIAWYENVDGKGSFSDQKVISILTDGASVVRAADADGDGDIDVFSASSQDHKIAWYENIDGKGSFSAQKVISNTLTRTIALFIADIDGDGDMDIAAAAYEENRPSSDNKIVWYENIDGLGSFDSTHIVNIDLWAGVTAINALIVVDMDDDNDSDIVAASPLGTIRWYENQNGSFEKRHSLMNNVFSPSDMIVTDIDGDSDPDIVFSSIRENVIGWYDNKDGHGSFSTEILLESQSIDGASFVLPSDVDGDGDVDVISGSLGDKKIAWYENNNGFGSQSVISEMSGSWNGFSEAADLNNDGKMDVLALLIDSNRVSWFENVAENRNKLIEHHVVSYIDRGGQVELQDLDGDGYDDIVIYSSGFDNLAIFSSEDGKGDFSKSRSVEIGEFIAPIIFSDIDIDGDVDILGLTNNGSLVLYENSDGKGNFNHHHEILKFNDRFVIIVMGDIDDDGYEDLITAKQNGNQLTWYRNLDGSGSFGFPRIVSIEVKSSNSIAVADLDGDDDLDIISTSFQDNKISWHENMDGKGLFSQQHLITNNTLQIQHVNVADMDNDGDIDILSASAGDDKIAWYENLGVTSTKDKSTLDFSIYPVPTTDYLTIISETEIAQIKIYNELGQLVLSNTNQRSIDISSLLQGAYMCKVENEKGEVGVKKVLKE